MRRLTWRGYDWSVRGSSFSGVCSTKHQLLERSCTKGPSFLSMVYEWIFRTLCPQHGRSELMYLGSVACQNILHENSYRVAMGLWHVSSSKFLRHLWGDCQSYTAGVNEKSKDNFYEALLFLFDEEQLHITIFDVIPLMAMNFWYRSKCFFIPLRIENFRLLTSPPLNRLLVLGTQCTRHHAFSLLQIHSWCPRLPPLLLTRFDILPWSRYPPSGCVLSCALLMDDQIGCSPITHVLPALNLSIHSYTFRWFILNQHSAMNFHTFQTFWTQISHYGALFLEDVIVEWRIHTSDLVAPCHSIDRWNVAHD